MSDIREKAKTFCIWQMTDCGVNCGSDYARCPDGFIRKRELAVPVEDVEDAQRSAEADIEKYKRFRDDAVARLWKTVEEKERLEGQIAEANKILNEENVGCSYDELAKFNATKLDRLRVALGEQKKETY